MNKNVSHKVYEALALLTPYDIDRPKIHIGNERDGAYIMVEPEAGQDIISFGVNDDVSFEKAMAERGHRSFMYDHTIDRLPEENGSFHWQKLGICIEGSDAPDLRTLKQHLADLPDPSERLILKIDVEGHEWGVFWQIDDETLQKFDQILIEFHWMKNLDQPGFLTMFSEAIKNINKYFTLYHVHGNNCAELHIVEGFPVVDVLEASYIRTDLVQRRPSQTVYPTSLNKGNRPDCHDLPLLFFPFLPVAVAQAQIDEVIMRIEADRVVPVS